jgi:hypothetical protein
MNHEVQFNIQDSPFMIQDFFASNPKHPGTNPVGQPAGQAGM